MLLELPADTLSAVMRLCSARDLGRLGLVCQPLCLNVRQQAEELLAELCAASTTYAARAAGAATIDGLAYICGRRPLVPRRFYCTFMDLLIDKQHKQYNPSAVGCVPDVDIGALQRTFLVFCGLEARWNRELMEPEQPPPAFHAFCEACIALLDFRPPFHLTTSHIDHALSTVFCKDQLAATCRLMKRLKDVDDEDSPAREEMAELGPFPTFHQNSSEELEFEENVHGVLIQEANADSWMNDISHDWYPDAASYFDLSPNFLEDNELLSHACGSTSSWRTPCECEGGSSKRCHAPCQCRLASLIFDPRDGFRGR